MTVTERLVAGLGPRRGRLFFCRTCRLFLRLADGGPGPHSPHPVVEDALRAIETFAETGKTKVALKRARQAVRALRYAGLAGAGADLAGWVVLPLHRCLWPIEVGATENAWSSGYAEIKLARSEHESFGPEFTRGSAAVYADLAARFTVPPAWKTSAVVGLAKSMKAARDYSVTPVLADALEEAGCDDPALLAHCRDHPDHGPGCGAVDAVLGLS